MLRSTEIGRFAAILASAGYGPTALRGELVHLDPGFVRLAAGPIDSSGRLVGGWTVPSGLSGFPIHDQGVVVTRGGGLALSTHERVIIDATTSATFEERAAARAAAPARSLIDPEARSFAYVALLPHGLTQFALGTHGDSLRLFGGVDFDPTRGLVGGSRHGSWSGLEPCRDVDVFDPVTGVCSTWLESLPVAAEHVRALAWRDRLLFMTIAGTDEPAARRQVEVAWCVPPAGG